MSLGYAEKLSYRADVGTVGLSEIFDPPEVLQQKIEELAIMIQKSKHLVAFTGAGISTSCGIPDFRGPKGVWTLQVSFPERPDLKTAFLQKQPFYLKRETLRKRPFKMLWTFNFSDGCGCSCTTVEWPINFQVAKDNFIRDKKEFLQELRDAADKESHCGQHAVLERGQSQV